MRDQGGNTIMHYRVTTAIPQAQGAIADPRGGHGPLGVNRAMPVSVDAAVPTPQEPLQKLEKSWIH